MSPALQKAMGGNKAIPKKAPRRDQLLDTPQQQQVPVMNRQPSPDEMMVDEFSHAYRKQEVPPQDDFVAMEEERMRAEENIYNTHLDAVKEEV